MRPGVRGHVLAVALVAAASLGAFVDGVSQGDAGWANRAKGELDGSPLPEPIRSSIRGYESALAERPGALDVRWKLLRSLHFAGLFDTDDDEQKRRTFERASRVADEGLAWLAVRAGGGEALDELDPESLPGRLEAASLPAEDVARLYFWAAINWGAWTRTVGLLSAVQQGVANRLHRYAQVTLALEPEYEEGGPYRLLGRLHARLPRVPFLSGWVDRERAIPLLERGYALAPEHPGNRLLLGMTLLDLAPERRAEAVTLLDEVVGLTPRPEMKIEDIAIRRRAREERAAADASES